MNEGTSGQFLLIFDCDMVAEPHFLEALMPHFYKRTGDDTYAVDKDIALVQSPQSFFGVPVNDPLGQQYRYFYGPVLQGWDGANCAPCCGTNVIFSRACLTSIGGFIYGSVTEDFLTSMYLHNAGCVSSGFRFGLGLTWLTNHDGRACREPTYQPTDSTHSTIYLSYLRITTGTRPSTSTSTSRAASPPRRSTTS